MATTRDNAPASVRRGACTWPVTRRAWLIGVAAAAGGCAGPLPPRRLYQLRALPPRDAAAVRRAAFAGVLSVATINMPEYLHNSAVLTRTGGGGLLARDSHRWAEPLPDAFARVLVQDLEARLGPGRAWLPPLPAGVLPTRELRVDVLRLDADEGERAVVLAARWLLRDPSPPAAPGQVPQVRLDEWSAEVATPGEVDSLVAAHSVVVARLADAVAAALVGPAIARRPDRPSG